MQAPSSILNIVKYVKPGVGNAGPIGFVTTSIAGFASDIAQARLDAQNDRNVPELIKKYIVSTAGTLTHLQAMDVATGLVPPAFYQSLNATAVAQAGQYASLWQQFVTEEGFTNISVSSVLRTKLAVGNSYAAAMFGAVNELLSNGLLSPWTLRTTLLTSVSGGVVLSAIHVFGQDHGARLLIYVMDATNAIKTGVQATFSLSRQLVAEAPKFRMVLGKAPDGSVQFNPNTPMTMWRAYEDLTKEDPGYWAPNNLSLEGVAVLQAAAVLHALDRGFSGSKVFNYDAASEVSFIKQLTGQIRHSSKFIAGRIFT